MYNFVRTNINSQEKVSFSHPMFQRGRGDIIPRIPRRKVITKKQIPLQQSEREETFSDEPFIDYQVNYKATSKLTLKISIRIKSYLLLQLEKN